MLVEDPDFSGDDGCWDDLIPLEPVGDPALKRGNPQLATRMKLQKS
jgi:hypothetical protein